MDLMKFCPQDGTALVPPLAPWRENLLEYEIRLTFAECPVCHKTARQLHRLEESAPSLTYAPARPAPPRPTALGKALRQMAAKLGADYEEHARRTRRPTPEESAALRARYLRDRYGR